MEIFNYSELPPGKPTFAMFSVYMPELQMTVHRVRVIRTKTGRVIVGYPSYCDKSADPQENPVFRSYLEFSKDKGYEMEKKILEALKPFVKIE